MFNFHIPKKFYLKTARRVFHIRFVHAAFVHRVIQQHTHTLSHFFRHIFFSLPRFFTQRWNSNFRSANTRHKDTTIIMRLPSVS